MDWADFYARTKRVVPPQELKSKRCWIGVLSHEKDPHSNLEETDFVWMIGHNKIPISKIHETYQKRYENLDFHIKFKDTIVEHDETIRSFLVPNDELVLFRACLPHQPLPQIPSIDQQPSDVANKRTVRPATHANQSDSASPSFARRVKDEPLDHSVLIAKSQKLTPVIPPLTPAEYYAEFSSPSGFVAASVELPTSAVQPVTINPSDRFSTTNQAGVGDPSTPHRSLEILPAGDYLVKPEGRPERYATPVFHHMDEDSQADFDPANFFNRDLSQEHDNQEDIRPTDTSIRKIAAQQDIRMLEAGVAQSLKVLQDLKTGFSHYVHSMPDAAAWTEAIDKLIPSAQRKRTIVGVVGNTGAGKSSVINAMLDEERLVPTNCMRACTAVVTEMSWNDSTDPLSKYRAEIEFISREDWQKELTTLMKEFLTDNGTVSREVSDENSDAGIAWAKFHSVYPKKTRDSLDECTVEGLMSEKTVLSVLGTTKTITTASPHSFYTQLQKYVDSKEKVGKKGKSKDSDSQKKRFEMEHWPLIKVVKIYVKAPALSTGAVIVDLPGVHDSNAARAAVAQGYMKQCTGLWIVAPINRAVDDKAAKNLLGESFKRQLKYDGGFSSVTFICSKTDDISITEAIDTLELNDEVEDLYNQQKQFEQEIEETKRKMDDLKEAQAVYKAAQTEASNDMDVWEQLRETLDDGNPAYAPKERSNKRRANKLKGNDAHKKRRIDHADSEDDFIVSDEEDTSAESDTESEDDDIQAPRVSLTEDDIKTKLKEIRETKKGARRESLEISEKIKELQPRIRDSRAKIAVIQAEISHICIAGRNDYSKRAIQQDFAAGLKELDQENAAEEDEDNFNPDEELRDYEAVARSLPVFCVSSRAYQKMSGRLQKDDPVPGFEVPEETEMPQLQAHCAKLTESGRTQTARSFLLNLCQQLTTFSLWASDDGTGLKMTDDDKRKQVRYLEKRLEELERGLEEAVRACLNVMKKEMNDQIFDKYPDLINEAIHAAPETAQKWGAHKSDGGLYWATYKAVVRRDGSYQSPSAGHRDFNAELVSPIIIKLATGWERAFQNRLPKAFDAFIRDSGKLLHSFHEAVEERARNNGVGLASLSALKMQINTHEQLFADLNQVLITTMTELQREANRDFTPTIGSIMHTIYDACANESGGGQYKRMKAQMSTYVDHYRHSMFNDATLIVKRHLDSMCRTLEDVMGGKADEIYIRMKADYMRVLGGVKQNQQAFVLPKEERALRSDVMKILRSIDMQFEPIARGELVEEEEETTAAAAGADTSAEAPVNVDVDKDEEHAFESAHESPSHDANNASAIDRNDDAATTRSTPFKHLATNADVDDSEEKENRSLPTPSDEEMDELEL